MVVNFATPSIVTIVHWLRMRNLEEMQFHFMPFRGRGQLTFCYEGPNFGSDGQLSGRFLSIVSGIFLPRLLQSSTPSNSKPTEEETQTHTTLMLMERIASHFSISRPPHQRVVNSQRSRLVRLACRFPLAFTVQQAPASLTQVGPSLGRVFLSDNKRNVICDRNLRLFEYRS